MMSSSWVFCLGLNADQSSRDAAKVMGEGSIYLPVPDRFHKGDIDWIEFADSMKLLRELHSGAAQVVLYIAIPKAYEPMLGELYFWLRRDCSERVVMWDTTQFNIQQLLTLGWAHLPEIEMVLPEILSLETERLLITCPTEEQSRGYFDAIVGTDIFENLIWEGPNCPDDLINFGLESRRGLLRENTSPDSFAVIEKSSGAMIGGISWRPLAHDPASGDLGYAFAPAFHGQGYATEAIARLLDFVQLVRKAQRVEAGVFVGNFASRRVLEKNGFACEGTKFAAVSKRDRRRDEWIFSKLFQI